MKYSKQSPIGGILQKLEWVKSVQLHEYMLSGTKHTKVRKSMHSFQKNKMNFQQSIQYQTENKIKEEQLQRQIPTKSTIKQFP
jgi:hypothetical protein